MTKIQQRSRLGTVPATGRRSSAASRLTAAPPALQVRAGQGSVEDVLLLQRLAGNSAVTRELVRLPEAIGFGSCDDTPELECSAKASRSFTKSIQVPAPSKKKDAEGTITYNGKGTASAQFTTAVKISLATVPTGLSKCAAGKYKTLIASKLSPHEQDHKKRFTTTLPAHSYNGAYKNAIKESGDDQAAVQASIKSKLDDALAAEVTKREERNDAYAITAIDPFHVTADISACPECKTSEEE